MSLKSGAVYSITIKNNTNTDYIVKIIIKIGENDNYIWNLLRNTGR